MQSQLCRYQISSAHLSVLARLYGLSNRQYKRLLTHRTSKDIRPKPVRDRFHGCGTLALKEALDT